MHRTVHVFLSRRRLQSICIVSLLVLASFSLGWGSFGIVEAQNNTNQSTANQDTTRVNEIISDTCSRVTSGNDTSGANTSQSSSVVEIRCILREARNAISADSANIVIAIITLFQKIITKFRQPTFLFVKLR